MKPLAYSLALMTALPLAAQAQGFGEQFLTNWDSDGNGQVTLEEVLERRGDLFYMFDADEDGRLNDEEYATFDETRALDREMHLEDYGMTMGQAAGPKGAGQAGQGQGARKGTGQGMKQGYGQGQGMTPGKGLGMAAGIESVQSSMTRLSNDLNGDGVVTRDEFVSNGSQWFNRIDRNHDGIVSLTDFEG